MLFVIAKAELPFLFKNESCDVITVILFGGHEGKKSAFRKKKHVIIYSTSTFHEAHKCEFELSPDDSLPYD